MGKAQAASEFLVVLGAALAIGLAVFGLLAYYPGTALDTARTQSDLFWKTAKPFSVEQAVFFANSECRTPCGAFCEPYVEFAIKNADSETLTMTNIYANDAHTWLCLTPDAPATIQFIPGETKVMEVAEDSLYGPNQFCTPDQINDSKPIQVKMRIEYQRNGVQQAETSTIKLWVDCSSNVTG